MSQVSSLQLEMDFGSELPTDRAPERAAEAALQAVRALKAAEESWFDSEAPTGVATERPILPRPPSLPRV